jgi:hypothetical protein
MPSKQEAKASTADARRGEKTNLTTRKETLSLEKTDHESLVHETLVLFNSPTKTLAESVLSSFAAPLFSRLLCVGTMVSLPDAAALQRNLMPRVNREKPQKQGNLLRQSGF